MLIIQITKIKFCQYQMRDVSPNFMLAKDSMINLYLQSYTYTMILEQTHTVRVSCCRLVTSNASSKCGPTVQLCLLPTEHMAVVVDATEAEEMQERYMCICHKLFWFDLFSSTLSLSLSLSLSPLSCSSSPSLPPSLHINLLHEIDFHAACQVQIYLNQHILITSEQR